MDVGLEVLDGDGAVLLDPVVFDGFGHLLAVAVAGAVEHEGYALPRLAQEQNFLSDLWAVIALGDEAAGLLVVHFEGFVDLLLCVLVAEIGGVSGQIEDGFHGLGVFVLPSQR